MNPSITLPFTTATPFAAFMAQHKKTIQSILDGHWFTRRGSVSDLEIHPGTDAALPEGKLKVSYTVSFVFACDGITTTQHEQSFILYTVSPDATQITLQAEPEPERYDEL